MIKNSVDEITYEINRNTAKRSGKLPDKNPKEYLMESIALIDKVSTEEQKRLHSLYSYHILDTPPETEYDELAQLAASICGCPLAAITFVDRNRQWFKAKVGDDVRETSRDISFCAKTILEKNELVVRDARKDERFARNPDVTGGLNIRFYAGVPILSSDNEKLGAVCVIDTVTRSITTEQLKVLELISKQVRTLLELRSRNAALQVETKSAVEEAENSFETFFNHAGVPKWIYDIETLQILQVNEAVIKKYGYSREEFLQKTVYDLRTTREKKKIHQLVQSVNGNNKPSTFISAHQTKNGDIIKVEVTITDAIYLGRPVRMATIIDITEKDQLKKALVDEKKGASQKINAAIISGRESERNFIGKELHDNVSQILASTKLFLDIAEKDEDIRIELIQRSRKNVIQAIQEVRALSHRLTKDKFEFCSSFRELVHNFELANKVAMDYNCASNVDELSTDLKVNVFRILQELLTNVSRHAKATAVILKITHTEGCLKIHMKDNGVGFELSKKPGGIGLENIRNRVQFYNGKLTIRSGPGEGTEFEIDFPLTIKSNNH